MRALQSVLAIRCAVLQPARRALLQVHLCTLLELRLRKGYARERNNHVCYGSAWQVMKHGHIVELKKREGAGGIVAFQLNATNRVLRR